MSEWQRLAEFGDGLQRTGSMVERQERWLMSCLRSNAATEFGKRWRFASIRSADEYCERVPLITYEDIEHDIVRMSNGEANVLFAGLPVAFERTGGSTRASKLIPYSAQSLTDFRSALLPWLGACIRQFDVAVGTAYFSISPATRQAETTAGGIPVGLPDGAYLGADALAAFAPVSGVPEWVGELCDVAEWQLATLYWLVRRPDLALISVWSPTFLLALLDALEARSDELAALMRDGGHLAGRDLAPDAGALGNLHGFLADGNAQRVWPKLKLVSCWADASSRPFFEALRQRLPMAAFQGKGLLSTEGVVTVPGADGRPQLTPDSGFYEFRSVDGELCTARDLVDGAHYEVVLTTSGGLYRYRTGDSVACEGHAGDLPVLHFTGRVGLTSDIVGEKLDEGFVSSCLYDVPGFRMLVPSQSPRPGYTLVVDVKQQHESTELLSVVDARLSKNPQYDYACRIGQLDSLSVCEASRPLDKYLERLAAGGTRLGDLKVTSLRAETDWLATFSRGAA